MPYNLGDIYKVNFSIKELCKNLKVRILDDNLADTFHFAVKICRVWVIPLPYDISEIRLNKIILSDERSNGDDCPLRVCNATLFKENNNNINIIVKCRKIVPGLEMLSEREGTNAMLMSHSNCADL